MERKRSSKKRRIPSEKKKYYLLKRKYYILICVTKRLTEDESISFLESKDMILDVTQFSKVKKAIKRELSQINLL